MPLRLHSFILHVLPFRLKAKFEFRAFGLGLGLGIIVRIVFRVMVKLRVMFGVGEIKVVGITSGRPNEM